MFQVLNFTPIRPMLFRRSQLAHHLMKLFTIALASILLTAPILHPQTVFAKSIPEIWSSIQRVLSPVPRPSRTAGGKGPETIISPGIWVDREAAQRIPQVWNLKPVILYQEPTNKQEAPTTLQLVDTKTEKVIQRFEVCGKSHVRLQVSEALKPDTVYRVEQLKNGENINSSVTFRMMSGAARNRLDRMLDTLEKHGKLVPQQLSERKVELFVQNQLWSDALQEMSQWVESDDDWHAFTAVTIDDWRKGDRVTLQP
jgi:hypothetical protein